MMRSLKTLSLYLSVLLMLFEPKGNAVIQPDCVTPVDSLGSCVQARFCISIMTALINNDHLTNPEVAKFLRESQCGLERNSHKVCCDVNDIDFGHESEPVLVDAPAQKLATNLQPPHHKPNIEKRLLDNESCGLLDDNETPLKWIGELWFEVESFGRTKLEAKCLATLISHKHLLVPAHCVASLPENITLDFVEIRGQEFSVSKIFIHASYNQPKFSNDIAIIELDKETNDELNDAVCMPKSQSGEHGVQSTITVVKRANSSLKFGKALFSSNSKCSSYFSQQLTDLTPGQFCANVQSNETDYSPFVGAVAIESDKKRRYTVKGFTSTAIRTEQASDESKPYIFTDIAHHLNWIQAAIGDEIIKEKKKNIQNSTDESESKLNLSSCQKANGDGFCVKLQQCSIYRNAPQPLSKVRENYLDEIKCFTSAAVGGNSVTEDGICCEEKYIELEPVTSLDHRFQGKRGIDLVNAPKCGQVDPTRRIVGGTNANLKEFPWIGLIKYRTGRLFKFTCGSSLISSKYLLTCAHCLTNLPSGFEIVAVRLGEYDRRTDPDCKTVDENQQECNPPAQDIPIEKTIPHPKYNTPRYANDVGLIRLARAPDMTQGIIPICLPINDEMQQTISEKYTVAGFGFTENGRDSDVLLKVVLPKVLKETCQSFHSSVIQLSEGHECYGGEGIRDSCKGDSGNPLMNYVNVNGRIKAVQLGIVAAGHSECGQGASGFPGIYSDIYHYLDWILDNLEV